MKIRRFTTWCLNARPSKKPGVHEVDLQLMARDGVQGRLKLYNVAPEELVDLMANNATFTEYLENES